MKTSRTALALVAVLALAGCGAGDPGAAPQQENKDKSPLAEYLGEGFSSGPAGGPARAAVRIGGPGSSEEERAKQRKVEEATAACMKEAGFEYVAVPPDQEPKSKFDDAFNLPPDKFAEQYGYGISTIDWSKAGPEDPDNPNTKIRNGLSATAKKAYDKALHGQAGNGNVIVAPADGKNTEPKRPTDLGCRGKAAEQVYGKGEQKADDFSKFESLFKDLEALRKRIETDQRVVDATSAWSDCLADAGHPGYAKPDDTRTKVSQKLDELTGTSGGPKDGAAVGPPSFDKVDSQKLAELRKFEIELAKADHACMAKGYAETYKQVQYEKEQEFVDQNKAQLEQFRDTMAER